MTEKEAITELEKYTNPSFKATALAISALEKQIPKKLKFECYFDYEGYKIGYSKCPNCDKKIGNIRSKRYCEFCGQKLDWM